MTYRLLDCYPGCGVAYAASRNPDVDYVGRRSEPGDPTAFVLEANRAAIGARWNHQIFPRPMWDVAAVDIVTGCPAGIRGQDNRGDFLRFALHVDAPVIVLDCCGPIGRSATCTAEMLATIAACAGPRRYLVTFVFYDELALGAGRQRRRCAVVASQVAFGVQRPEREFDWPVPTGVRIRRGHGAELTPAVRGYGPEWVWPEGPDLRGMSPWVARWLVGWIVASLSARPGALRGEQQPDGSRVLSIRVLDRRDRRATLP